MTFYNERFKAQTNPNSKADPKQQKQITVH